MSARLPKLSEIIVAALALGLGTMCVLHQKSHFADWHVGSGEKWQRVRLPEPELIKVASLGYEQLYADVLTLRAVQMFGGNWRTPGDDPKPIYEYFDTVTELDSKFADVYELSNLVLSDSKGAHKLSLDLLRKGILHNPYNWRLPYLAIYTCLWGLNDPRYATEFLNYAHRNPTTPEHVLRLEEYIERQQGKYFAAFDVNLRNYLRYVHQNMRDEEQLSIFRFQAILEALAIQELTHAAQKYYDATGEHPRTVEDLLVPEYAPDYDGPNLHKMLVAVDKALQEGGDIREKQDEIREASIEKVHGLPPNPEGLWYFLSPEDRQGIISRNIPKTAKPEERFGYFFSAQASLDRINAQSTAAQKYVMDAIALRSAWSDEKIEKSGKSWIELMGEALTTDPEFRSKVVPSAAEMARHGFLGPDGFGGHYVYEYDGRPDSAGFPVFYSTTTMRLNEKREPRVGLSGMPDSFPRRPYFVGPGLPPYLTTNPSLWDFEEDANWASAVGLVPGIPDSAQDPELIKKARTAVVE